MSNKSEDTSNVHPIGGSIRTWVPEIEQFNLCYTSMTNQNCRDNVLLCELENGQFLALFFNHIISWCNKSEEPFQT